MCASAVPTLLIFQTLFAIKQVSRNLRRRGRVGPWLGLVLFLVAGIELVQASPAPAPTLVSPAPNATNVDPDGTLTWNWVDELIDNGSFEQGMTPGWYTGGPNPGIWSIFTSTTNAYGMGYRFAGVTMPLTPTAMGQLIQDLYIPAGATTATLQWNVRITSVLPPPALVGRLRIFLFQNGTAVAKLMDATGTEPPYSSRTWVSGSTNMLAYAGQYVQLVVQADSYSPQAVNAWYADVDGFSLSCEHPSTPDFQIYVGKSSVLRPTNMVSETAGLSCWSVALEPLTGYYWKVGAVRDGVTNYSGTAFFRTGQRAPVRLTVAGYTDYSVQLGFPTRTNRWYTIEQIDGLEGNSTWTDVLDVGAGTGGTVESEVPLPGTSAVFWRVRVTPF